MYYSIEQNGIVSIVQYKIIQYRTVQNDLIYYRVLQNIIEQILTDTKSQRILMRIRLFFVLYLYTIFHLTFIFRLQSSDTKIEFLSAKLGFETAAFPRMGRAAQEELRRSRRRTATGCSGSPGRSSRGSTRRSPDGTHQSKLNRN